MMELKIQKVKNILGKLSHHAPQKYTGVLNLSHSSNIKYLLCLEGKPMDDVLLALEDNLALLEESFARIREDVAKDVLDEVNEDWLQEEGRKLSLSEMANNISLESVTLLSGGDIIVYLDVAEELLGGHGIEVSYSSDGKKDSEAMVVG